MGRTVIILVLAVIVIFNTILLKNSKETNNDIAEQLLKSQLRNVANSGIHLTISKNESKTKQFDNILLSTEYIEYLDEITIVSVTTSGSFSTKTIARLINNTYNVNNEWNWVEILSDIFIGSFMAKKCHLKSL